MTINLSDYPPAPVTWAYNSVDTLLCGSNWRSWLPATWTQAGAWFSPEFRLEQSVPDLLPHLQTYPEYLLAEQQTTASISSLYRWMFHTSNTSLADPTSPSSWLVLLVLVVLIRRTKRSLLPLFSHAGRLAGRATHGPKWEHDNEIRIVKFGEYVFRLVFHGGISLAGMVYFWDKSWWAAGGTPTLWLDYPAQPIAPGMIWYYLVQGAYNLDAMWTLLELSFVVTGMCSWEWSPTVRGDFREMFVHHVVTNLLVLGSSFFRFTRVGSMVFLVHDVSDVPVDLSKLANFLKWKRATIVCFSTMVVVWCRTRLGTLLLTIYRSVLYESWMVTESGVIDPIYYVHYQPFFVVLIGLLLLLHFAWFLMFLRMGFILVLKGETHDYSEHKAGEHHRESSSSNGKKLV